MSESIRRRSSSRQLLQNLIRVTAQRSQEDAEEAERERRRRARDQQRGDGSPPRPEAPPQGNGTHSTQSEEELKPGSCLVLEEDEGFSDWSHRLENRNEQEPPDEFRVKEQRPSAAPDPKEETQQEDGEEDRGELEPGCLSEDVSTRPPKKTSLRKPGVRTSYSSSVFVSQDSRLQHAAGQPPDRTSYLAAGTMKPRGGASRADGEERQEKREEEEVEPTFQWESAGAPDCAGGEEDLEYTHAERTDPHLQKMLSLDVSEEEQTVDIERPEDGGSWGRQAASSSSAGEGEESLSCYGPMSPTFKKLLIQFYPDEVNSRVSPDGKCSITERTESLRRSVGNIKKMVPPVPVSKIDKKLEQYAHALEVSSKEGRSQVLTDLTSPSEPVAAKKNLFEAREAWNQHITTVTPSKDADGSKVAVADLINQWVKGGEDGSRCSSPSKPPESTSKRYKYVVTGHGKYEKVSVAHGRCENANYQAAGQFYEDL